MAEIPHRTFDRGNPCYGAARYNYANQHFSSFIPQIIVIWFFRSITALNYCQRDHTDERKRKVESLSLVVGWLNVGKTPTELNSSTLDRGNTSIPEWAVAEEMEVRRRQMIKERMESMSWPYIVVFREEFLTFNENRRSSYSTSSCGEYLLLRSGTRIYWSEW